ncbi:hypothetical protein AMAG_17859 [Allomyces macrogynus ATCC 38327]|uniref:Uncharacterized protein n=1 Tax=Allomyces macrogynus (strain ATCC 38327) TaxID=578462 RepID=A0A0L0S0V1_ALLM3|nr:hypothetical protein AMAG_17859 [Allomyces macrogynus ATCC 38327]|eukprot:KNE55996.1 hypothetical protein AMAG_17859 [Allomyces macrogynus ATCC 38327]
MKKEKCAFVAARTANTACALWPHWAEFAKRRARFYRHEEFRGRFCFWSFCLFSSHSPTHFVHHPASTILDHQPIHSPLHFATLAATLSLERLLCRVLMRYFCLLCDPILGRVFNQSLSTQILRHSRPFVGPIEISEL